MALITEQKDLTNWGLIFIALIVVVAVIVGMGIGYHGKKRSCPRYMRLSRSALEGFEPTPEWANYKALPALPIPDLANCARYLGAPPAPVDFPKSKNPYFPAVDWTISFWVKFNSLMTTESFPLMRKGTISQNGTPSILFERRPYVAFAGMTGNEGPNNKPCIAFTYKINNPLTKNYFGNNYATVCPGVTPLEAGKWKFIAWVQRGPEMTLYEDGQVIYYNTNAPLDMSPGNLRFSAGDNHPATLRNVTVCRGAKSPAEIANMYKNENPAGQEGISSQFRRLIQAGGPFRASKNSPTATYRAKKENISGTFYELIEVENYVTTDRHPAYAVSRGSGIENAVAAAAASAKAAAAAANAARTAAIAGNASVAKANMNKAANAMNQAANAANMAAANSANTQAANAAANAAASANKAAAAINAAKNSANVAAIAQAQSAANAAAAHSEMMQRAAMRAKYAVRTNPKMLSQ